MLVSVKAKSLFWLGYFVFSILVLGFFILTPFAAPLYLLGFVYSPARRLADRLLRFAVWVLLSNQPWLQAKIEIESVEKGVLYISNHRSHLDAFLVLSRVPGIRFLAKKTLFYTPLLGPFMFLTRQIPARKGDIASFRHAMTVVQERLKGGEKVLVFPELTRCEPGNVGTRAFVLAPFWAAMETHSPIVPLVVKGTDQVWGKGQWEITSGKPISIRNLPPVDPRQFENADDLRAHVQGMIQQALVG